MGKRLIEREWLAGNDPERLIAHYGKRFTERKARLIMLACCRRHPAALKHPSVRGSIKYLADHYADPRRPDEPIEGEKPRGLHAAVDRYTERLVARKEYDELAFGVGCGVLVAVKPVSAMKKDRDTFEFQVRSCTHDIAFGVGQDAKPAEAAAQADIVREVLGNPFKRVTVPPAWRTDTVLALARQAYESEDFSMIPILADALQDAGCDNKEVLDHCRDPKQIHHRGCWVLDLLLAKA